MSAWLDAFVPAFALLALGALLKRRLLRDDTVWAGMERLIYWVLLPSLIVAALAPLDLASLPLGRIAVAIWIALGVGSVVSVLLARALRHGHPAMTSVLQGGIRFNNLMGFAIVGALFGAEGTGFGAVATGMIVPFVQVVTTLAFAFDGKRGPPRPLMVVRQLALNPLLLAVATGFLIALLGGLPPGLAPTVQTLGRASVALGLLCVGAALSLDSFTDRVGTQAVTGVLKLMVMPAMTWGLCVALGVPPFATAIAVIFMALPTAATSYVMARAMGGDAPLMAAITTTEHIASIVTLPFWVWLVAP
ncbi:AEC family transporter [Roseomonas terrae]|jgi:malonate transporter|uniref:AEC family transporter n=1 Tax=Neoroseomonas terrae TaxID=424799 RepID=A0ABS5ENB5_9PROT|nr:AEC family transporter [Neoroseomonas terrae]MBR0652515.1 AEC family transporter [Neoroseomonas terrae]